MIKNVAGQHPVQCQVTNASTGAPFTGAVTVYVTGDGGTRAVGTVGAGAATHEGGGLHSYAPSQAETNYDHVSFQFEGTGAITAAVHFTTAVDLVTNAVDSSSLSSTAVNKIAERLGATQAAFAQAGTSSTITLVAGALATDDIHNGMLIAIREGTGNGQCRLITDYNGTTKVATVSPNWTVTPDATSEYSILPARMYTPAEIVAAFWTDATSIQLAVDAGNASAEAATAAASAGTVVSRLTSARAGYLDNLSAGAVATAAALATVDDFIDTEVSSIISTQGAHTSTLASLATASALATAQTDLTTLLGRLTALRAGYLDALASGIASAVDVATEVWDEVRGDTVYSAATNAVQASAIHPGVAAVGASTITIVSGLGGDLITGQMIQYQGQVRRITDYVSATGVVTVSPAWSPSITTGDEARVYPSAPVRVDEIATDAISAASLATAAVTKITDAIKAMTIEGSRTFAQTLRGLWSLGLTKASGFNTGTIVTRDAADSKDRMTIVTGSTGRTSVTVGDLD